MLFISEEEQTQHNSYLIELTRKCLTSLKVVSDRPLLIKFKGQNISITGIFSCDGNNTSDGNSPTFQLC